MLLELICSGKAAASVRVGPVSSLLVDCRLHWSLLSSKSSYRGTATRIPWYRYRSVPSGTRLVGADVWTLELREGTDYHEVVWWPIGSRMPTIHTNDIETYYERRGDGPPIVFIHGAILDHSQWTPQRTPTG